MKRMIFLCFLAVLAAGAAFSARAESDPQVFVLDGTEYTKDQIIEDFLNVAFSDLQWNADAGEEDRQKILESLTRMQRSKINNSSPLQWFAKHLYRNADFKIISRNVITKWPGPVVGVGIDWPRYAKINKGRFDNVKPNTLMSPYSNSKIVAYYDRFSKSIESQIRVLEQSTGLTVKLITPDNTEDWTETTARIRIIPTFNFGLRTFFQTSDYIYHPQSEEELLLNGVLFQSYTPWLFDGYLLPDDGYFVDVALCKLDPREDERILLPLINECLVRSLGLPSISSNSESLLSIWHSQKEDSLYQRRFRQYLFQIDDQLIKSSRLQSSEDLVERSASTYQNYNKSEALRRLADRIVTLNIEPALLDRFKNVPEYERVMISLLYCPSIQSGMSKDDVEKILRGSEACFDRARAAIYK